jgi:prefoldin subunit 5
MQALPFTPNAQAIFLQKHGFNSQQTEGLVEFVMSAIEHSKQNLATQQDVSSLQNNMLMMREDMQTFQNRTIQEFIKVHHKIDSSIERLDNKIDYSIEKLDKKIDSSIEKLDSKIDRLEQKFDQKFIEVDNRFAQIDKRFEQVDKRFEQVDKRFEKIEKTLDAFKQKFTDIEKSIIKTSISLGSVTVATVAVATTILSLLN